MKISALKDKQNITYYNVKTIKLIQNASKSTKKCELLTGCLHPLNDKIKCQCGMLNL